MKRFYEKYHLWEDFKNGMYELIDNSEDLERNAISILSDENIFSDLCLEVINNWKISAMVNLTNTGCNRRAWLGQATCCYKHKVPETITRTAWAKLTEEQRIKANEVADKYINLYELGYKEYISTFRNGKIGAIKTEFQMKLPYDWSNYEKFLLIG